MVNTIPHEGEEQMKVESMKVKCLDVKVLKNYLKQKTDSRMDKVNKTTK